MRFFCVLTLAVVAGCASGCNDGSAPPAFENDLSANANTDGGDDLAIEEDLAGVDLLPPPGDLLPGADLQPMCRTACDCPSGQRCSMGSCTTAMPMVFCCGAATCPSAQVCETPTFQVSQCGNPDGGVNPDAGATVCTSTPCIQGPGSNAFCTLACGVSATCKNNNRCGP